MQQLAGILKESRRVEEGLNNIFLDDKYIGYLKELIDETPEGETRTALLVYIAALEDAWRYFDDYVDIGEPDYEDIWHRLDQANAQIDGKTISYDEAEKTLKSLNADLQEEAWELFLDGKVEYYSSAREDDE